MTTTAQPSPLAVVTGASRGFGAAVAEALAGRGWRLVVDARGGDALHRAAGRLGPAVRAAVVGDIADPAHRIAIAEAVSPAVEVGDQLQLLVHNASTLGPTPMRRLDDLDPAALARVLAVNTIAPLALTQLLLSHLTAARGCVVSLSSDAAVEAYETWGAYAASKAALDQMTAVLAAEQPLIRAYSFDPGDMRTQLHADAFPGEDISDRPPPETVVPALLRLLDERPQSGRFRGADLQLHQGARA